MGARRTRAGLARRTGEQEPEGLGEAVAAGSLTLALMTALAFVGFAWERNRERSAHLVAVELVERVSADGRGAALLPWSGYGAGPTSTTAGDTFDAVRSLGPVAPRSGGTCRIKSRPATCAGARFDCNVEGVTPAGRVDIHVGLCRDGTAGKWSFDTLDATIPKAGALVGNRAFVETGRDGLIRFGSEPPPPDAPSLRLRRRGLALPFVWSAF